MEVPTVTIACPEGPPPLMTSSLVKGAARTRYLPDLLFRVPDPRKRRVGGTSWPGCWPSGSRR